VSPFLLDTYEVTVARFRNFVKNYPHIPAPGDGKNPNNATDPGWLKEWNALLPATKEDLENSLKTTECDGSLYTKEGPINDKKPINCIDWFTAFAFCIWDGGRLPTEVEWNYAAAGGGQERYFPWSVPPTNQTIDLTYATYAKAGTTPAPTNVGFTVNGMSRWGQFDLSGNVYEWVLDVATDNYPTTETCVNCAVTGWTDVNVRTVRGGAFISTTDELTSSFRSSNMENSPNSVLSVRCVRNAD
jgi:formylglycine-generating enzyme required for sulfatase activity